MDLNKSQYLTILGSILFFALLYFGCETKPSDMKELEKSRALQLEATGFDNLVREATQTLSKEDLVYFNTLRKDVQNAILEDSSKIKSFEQLSSFWYRQEHIALSGYYAEEIAKLKNDEEAWSIAGTTFALGITTAGDQKVRNFCSSRAISAFENALSLNPDKVGHRINIALCNVENPPTSEPMKGILQLRELNDRYPQNVSVLNNLARLAIRTNQIDKAIERLNQAISIDNQNSLTVCLLADAYQTKGDNANFELYRQQCLLYNKN